MRRTSFAVALAAVAVASPLSAQTWQTIGTPSNSGTGAYWNNVSDDNVGSAVCNAGAILTNTPALAAGSCSNQAPVYLPLSPAPLTTAGFFLGNGANNPGGFGFNCATGCTVGFLGRIAGNTSTSWGAVTSTGTVFTAAQLQSGAVVTGSFALWITQAIPAAGSPPVFTSGQSIYGGGTTFSATGNQQFAVFSSMMASTSAGFFGTMINANGTYYVGMEDNTNGGPAGRGWGAGNGVDKLSDRDYNDILVSVSSVPEPATVGLMGFGLLALAGIAKRRKA